MFAQRSTESHARHHSYERPGAQSSTTTGTVCVYMCIVIALPCHGIHCTCEQCHLPLHAAEVPKAVCPSIENFASCTYSTLHIHVSLGNQSFTKN